MKYFYLFILLLFQKFLIYNCEKTKLHLISFSYNDGDFFDYLKKDFNKFAEENGLDAELDIIIFTPSNTTSNVDEFGGTLEYLLNKGSQKYDIFIYDVMYSSRYGAHLEDLSNGLSPEHIAMYADGVAKQTCNYKGKWIGLPLYALYNVLYVNSYYLGIYNKTIPQTWDELIKTGEEILRREAQKGNNYIYGYNGIFPENEDGTISTIEMIYSFRKTKDSPYPSYKSKEALRALQKIKELKDKLSTDDIYKEKAMGYLSLFFGNALFIKNMYFPWTGQLYKAVPIVGDKPGVSTSIIMGLNVAINKYISPKKKELAFKAVERFTSIPIQKNITLFKSVQSAINDLYDDPEICSVVNCDLIKKLQPISRPGGLTSNYDVYSKRIMEAVGGYLYGNKTAKHALTSIKDLTYIYEISLDPEESPEGLIIFTVTILMIILFISSIGLLFVKEFQKKYEFLQKESWILIIFGYVCNLCYIFTEYGKLSSFKCHFRIILILFGFNLRLIIILYKLIVRFPVKDKVLAWIEKNRYKFFLILIVFDILLCWLFFSTSYKPSYRFEKGTKTYRKCKLKHKDLNALFIFLLIFDKIVYILFICLYVFLEWNIKKNSKDIKLASFSIYIDVLLYILLIIMYSVDIKKYNFKFLFKALLVLFLTFSNFVILYILRLFVITGREDEEKDSILNVHRTTDSNIISSRNYENSTVSKNKSALSIILKYHYYSGNNDSNLSVTARKQESSTLGSNKPKL